MVFGCAIVAFVSVFAWIMSDVFLAPSFKGYEAVPCRIVKSSVTMEKVNRFVQCPVPMMAERNWVLAVGCWILDKRKEHEQ